MKNGILLAFCLISTAAQLVAQVPNSDNKFQRPLNEVLKDVENRFHVKLRISDNDVEGKILDYADWRFRPDFAQSLKNILAPFDLVYLPDGAEGKYKIEKYRYHLKTVSEAKDILDYLASLYSNKAEWETRRMALKSCIMEAVRLSPMPASPGTEPIFGLKRKMNGYTIQNLALEVLPGVYVCGSLYQPSKMNGKVPVILSPNGHFADGRYNKDMQARCAGLARMGAMAVSYDLFAWGESTLQFDSKLHQTSMANTIQALNSIRLLDYLLSLENADACRVGITGGSGGGSHAMLISAIDDRIKVSVPTVMMSAIHYGGCPCESGNPIHLCGGGTNNVEIAALFAPKPQLIISDGGDWTANVPELEFPYLKRIYGFYGTDALVQNVHHANEKHDYGPSKREAMYHFMARQFKLYESAVFDKEGKLDESGITIESTDQLKVFGTMGEKLPPNAIHGMDRLMDVFEKAKK